MSQTMTAADQKSPKPKSAAPETKGGDRTSALGKLPSDIGTDYSFKRKIVWKNAIGFLILHLAALYGQYLCFYCHKATVLWATVVAFIGAEGITIGAHRLYSHKTFKAKFPLRLALVILQTMAGQNCLYIWVRDHRQHHKFSDTDADPHNAHRGFFFSHIGWLMSRKHPAVIEKGKDYRYVGFGGRSAGDVPEEVSWYYKPLYTFFAILLPISIPIYFWNETLTNAFFVAYIWRYIIALNATWCVNSYAHLWGTKPYDQFILPVESHFVAFISVGEGWHNYHHAFPWDYRAAELGSKYCFTTFMIDFFAYLGQAYDLKSAPYNLIKNKALRTGDGSHFVFKNKKTKSPEDKLMDGSYLVDPEDEKAYNVGSSLVERSKKILPEVGQRAMTVQG
ncbi:hypothetical protein NQ317_008405 [Molorchus minor]|uniref:Fatty acid desaturase domain-containing protein n=1 Tax=Molorchus minor TaxID=1323400 RepID=A0ABQ9K468_9CUCU|nr:hypothetical protein NQ317_008405 [Molorchus minor]